MVSNIILTAYTWATTRIAMFKEERGQDILEYAVIAGAIALVAAASWFFFDWGVVFDDFATVVGDCISFGNVDGSCAF